MITLQRARDRPQGPEGRAVHPADEAFGALRGCFEQLTSETVEPGQNLVRPMAAGAEVVVYVGEGSLDFNDGLGRAGSLIAGDFLRLTAATNIGFSVSNSSLSPARVYQIYLSPAALSVEPASEQCHLTVAERRGLGCVVASRDGRGGSMRLLHDTCIHSGVLRAGQHVVHVLTVGRVAWVHVVEGQVSVAGTNIRAGDRVCVSRQRTASITAHQPSEVLLIDVIASTR